MIQTTLFNTSMKLDRSADQSHLQFRMFVPHGMEKIEVDFSYNPTKENDFENVRDIIQYHVNHYDPHLWNNQKAVEKMLPLKNLLTISIDDPNGFRGSCHRWEPETKIMIQKEHSTPGMLNREIVSGMWNIVVNCHAIITEECHLQLSVTGFHADKQAKRWYNKPFESAEFPLKTLPLLQGEERKDYKWTKSEIHTHTNHSDASQTIEELLVKAKELGIEYLAVTDHNTMSAIENLEELDGIYHLNILRGIEWTTFYGHLLTLGYDKVTAINWSNVGPLTMEENVKEIKNEGAIVGIAHPFRPGSPFCTGCNWEYETLSLECFDFIEVWNGENPQKDKYNMEAFRLWTNLLNKGHHIPATCGRDWHNNETDKDVAFLYTYIPKTAKDEDFCYAIKNGHSYITLGPKIDFTINHCFIPGDRVSKSLSDSLIVNVNVDDLAGNVYIEIETNHGSIYKVKTDKVERILSKSEELIWVRICIYSETKEMIAFTNPIYLVD